MSVWVSGEEVMVEKIQSRGLYPLPNVFRIKSRSMRRAGYEK
jgi:hypothetical protein